MSDKEKANKVRIRPEVSVIIPLYNRVDLTHRCLEALFKNTGTGVSFETILVDNGSTDGTPEFLKEAAKQFPGITIISNEQNQGFAAACNAGAEKAEANNLLFLNNDTEVLPGWLNSIKTAAESRDDIGAVACKLLFPDGTIQHAGVVVVKDERLGSQPSMAHVHYRRPADYPEADQFRYYQVLTAACFLVKREMFREVGGFDEEYYNGYEDVDLCLKIREQGYRLAYQPEAQVIHHEFGSGCLRFAKGSRNLQLFREKWGKNIIPDYIRTDHGPYRLNPAGPMVQLNKKPPRKILPLASLPASYVSADYFQLGEIHRAEGNSNWKYYYKKALWYLRAGEQRNAAELYRIGSIYKRLGSLKASMEWFRKVTETSGDTELKAGAYYHIGEMLFRQQNRKDAYENFHRAVRLNPDHRKAKEYLENQ